MEEDGPFPHGPARPLLERVQTGQELQMLWAEFVQKLINFRHLFRFKRRSADVLNLVVFHAQCLRDPAVGEVFA